MYHINIAALTKRLVESKILRRKDRLPELVRALAVGDLRVGAKGGRQSPFPIVEPHHSSRFPDIFCFSHESLAWRNEAKRSEMRRDEMRVNYARMGRFFTRAIVMGGGAKGNQAWVGRSRQSDRLLSNPTLSWQNEPSHGRFERDNKRFFYLSACARDLVRAR